MSRPELRHGDTYSFLHLAPTDLLVAHTGEGDVGVDQGRCGKEADLFRRIAGSLAHMMLKLARSTISDRTYTTPKSVLIPV
jgi:hypothetical protein